MKVQIRRTLLGLLVGCAGVPALGPLATPAAAAPAGCRTATPGAVAEFFDTRLPGRLAADRVPGAAVSVAAGGTTAFSKGYGLADVEHHVPFDATRSLVRIASISKLFTWTAVMQQVAAGRLDLDDDVNRYLTGFAIPRTYPQPITLRHLMSHTAGFEDFSVDTAARDPADVPPLGQYLAEHLPARIRPPGEISAYSNYGAALAGYIVSQVSGTTYDDYLHRHVLAPLAMTRSTAAEPVPPALAPDLARSYDTEVTPPAAYPFTFDQMPPDGSVSTTAADMARFMNAHLHDGILDPQTTARMHQRSFTADPRIDGYAHGFKERTSNGHRVLLHDGGWEGFASVMMLVPDCDLGLFFTTNSRSGAGPDMQAIIDAFFDRFAPEGGGSPAPAVGSSPDGLARPSAPTPGFYKPTRHNATTFEKLTTLVSPSRLTIDGDGAVHFRGKVWAQQGGDLYRAPDGDRLVFLAGTDGRRYVATDGAAAELMPAAETPLVNMAVLLAVLLPASGTLVLLAGAIVRVVRRRAARTTRRWRRARGVAVGAALLDVVFLVVLGVILAGNTDEFLFHVPLHFRLLLLVPVLATAVAVAAVGLTAQSWRGSGAGVVARTHQVTLLAGHAALVWFVWQWNLIA
ncbi:serine hydrolase domain-containing protein [Actinoplanes sp. NPDC051859]|uniref:serine hydrolase domain-containing protein n=1 Tax=Actinoplanes sp. NPDC051859 TaxID=3363909 RepID=UPI0037AA9F96